MQRKVEVYISDRLEKFSPKCCQSWNFCNGSHCLKCIFLYQKSWFWIEVNLGKNSSIFNFFHPWRVGFLGSFIVNALAVYAKIIQCHKWPTATVTPVSGLFDLRFLLICKNKTRLKELRSLTTRIKWYKMMKFDWIRNISNFWNWFQTFWNFQNFLEMIDYNWFQNDRNEPVT